MPDEDLTALMWERLPEALLHMLEWAYPDVQLEGVQYVIPQRGDKKQLLDLSERNVSYFRLDRERQRNLKKEDSSFNILKTIKLELNYHIVWSVSIIRIFKGLIRWLPV